MTTRTAPLLHTCTVVDAAEQLNVTRTTVTRWIQAGHLNPIAKLPGIRGAYLLDQREIKRLAEERA